MCVWVSFILNGPPNAVQYCREFAQQNHSVIAAKRNYKNQLKLVTQKGAGASFGRQMHIGQPTEVILSHHNRGKTALRKVCGLKRSRSFFWPTSFVLSGLLWLRLDTVNWLPYVWHAELSKNHSHKISSGIARSRYAKWECIHIALSPLLHERSERPTY